MSSTWLLLDTAHGLEGGVVGTPPDTFSGLTGSFVFSSAITDVDGVERWPNAGSAADLIQDTGSQEPAKTATGILHDSDDYLSAAGDATNWANNSASSFVIRCRCPTEAIGIGFEVGTSGIRLNRISFARWTITLEGGAPALELAAGPGDFVIIQCFHDGVTADARGDEGAWTSIAKGALTLAANVFTNSRNPGAEFSQIEISHWYFYNEARTRAELETIREWLADQVA